MTPEAISACAETLLQAEATRRQCGLSRWPSGATLDDAYADPGRRWWRESWRRGGG
jgi:hypothetical protein